MQGSNRDAIGHEARHAAGHAADARARPGAGRGVGRPAAASRALLQEAAFELFQRHGYAAVTVERIARAAGVSRATFFNHFEAKSDVFWVEVDAVLERVVARLGAASPQPGPPLAALRRLLLAELGAAGAAEVPWALTNAALLGDVADLHASALRRIQGLTTAIAGSALLTGRTVVERRTLANAAAGTLIAAVLTWAEAGLGRGPLGPYLEAGFAALE